MAQQTREELGSEQVGGVFEGRMRVAARSAELEASCSGGRRERERERARAGKGAVQPV